MEELYKEINSKPLGVTCARALLVTIYRIEAKDVPDITEVLNECTLEDLRVLVKRLKLLRQYAKEAHKKLTDL